MTIKVGHNLNQGLVSSNIKAIYASSFFQDVKFDKGSKNELIVYVVEKPTIYNIIYDGFHIVSSSSLKGSSFFFIGFLLLNAEEK
jgi:outer membrane protein assembly factor BamA